MKRFELAKESGCGVEGTMHYDNGKSMRVYMTHGEYQIHKNLEEICKIVGEENFKKIEPLIEEALSEKYDIGYSTGNEDGYYAGYDAGSDYDT